MNYKDFLSKKEFRRYEAGFTPIYIPDSLFDFQKFLVEWALLLGRAAIFADCGLGKSFISLVLCENVVRKYNKKALIVTPLAVSQQFVTEGAKFGIEVKKTQDGKSYKGINVTNYERLLRFDPEDFDIVVFDESQRIKAFDSKTRRKVTDFAHKVRHRLLATATPAPNDFMELGSSSEALGYMSRSQMLGTFFTNDGEQTQQWNLKGHASRRFWQWMATWARAILKPSDIGFSDEGFVLPGLDIKQHILKSDGPRSGFFPYVAKTLKDQKKESKRSLQQRCEYVSSIIPRDRPCIIWCNLNKEADVLKSLISDAVEVRGTDKDEIKEERLIAFTNGQIRCLISKARVAGFGLNWQHCADVSYFPTNSYMDYYQSLRRCYRFGQKRRVNCHIVAGEGERLVVQNMLRKEKQSAEMYRSIVQQMNAVLREKIRTGHEEMRTPAWL